MNPFEPAPLLKKRARRLLAGLTLLASAAACTRAPTAPEPSAAPNVLLVTFDTLRADYLEPYGGTTARTPSFGSLAEASVVFESAFATVPLTYPSLWSLLNSNSIHQYTYATDLRERPRGDGPLAARLAELGYRTAAVTGSSILDRGRGFEEGFEIYRDTWNELWLDNETTLARTLELADEILVPGGGSPYFLYVHFFDPHDPWGDAPSRFNVHGPEQSALSAVLESPEARAVSRLPIIRPESKWRDALGTYLGTPGLEAVDRAGTFYRLFVPSYRAEVEWSDDILGRLLAAFEERGLMDETLLIVSSDHGIAFADHHMVMGYVFDLFNEVVRVPLLIKAPASGTRRVAEPVSLLDIGATVVDYAGGGDRFGDGSSLRAYLEGGERPARGAYAETVAMRNETDFSGMFLDNPGERYGFGVENIQSMLAVGDLKLIHMPSRDGVKFELYDLREDPMEQHDLFDPDSGDHRALVRKLLELRLRGADRVPETPDEELEKRLRALGYLGD